MSTYYSVFFTRTSNMSLLFQFFWNYWKYVNMLFRMFHANKKTRITCCNDIPTFEKTNPLFLKFILKLTCYSLKSDRFLVFLSGLISQNWKWELQQLFQKTTLKQRAFESYKRFQNPSYVSEENDRNAQKPALSLTASQIYDGNSFFFEK